MALMCRHDHVLWVVNMHSAGEKQFAVILLIEMLFKHLQGEVRVGILYDIACMLERSCLKWGFLSRFIDRIAFAVSVFHAFGHEWACQLLYHPHKRTGFGYSNARAYHNRLYTLDAQIHHTDETSLLRLGQWVARRRAHCVGKRAEATKAFREAGKTKSLLRRTKTRGQKAVNAVMLLRSALKTRRAHVQELRQKFLDAVENEDPLAAIYEMDLESAQDALRKAEVNLQRKEEALGVGQFQELEALANSVYMRCRMNARALKLWLWQRLRARKFELDPVERTLRRLVNDSKLHAHTTSTVKRREPMISKLASEYNKLCAQIAKLIKDGQALPGSIAPLEIPPKGLWQLDVDDTIFQDVGLDDDDNNATGPTEPPLWLCDSRETCSLRVWFAEEWKMVQHALLDTDCEVDKYHLQLREDKLYGAATTLGPSAFQLSKCNVDAHMAARGEDRHYREESSDEEDVGGKESGGEDDEFGTLDAVERADVYLTITSIPPLKSLEEVKTVGTARFDTVPP
ncbi:hypothetical protein B0H13DRAFT_1905137 [Mycena leptocephala]|nr:hypothetical protein B0H13DRAFT_1905137 [Mycena leptocephala]